MINICCKKDFIYSKICRYCNILSSKIALVFIVWSKNVFIWQSSNLNQINWYYTQSSELLKQFRWWYVWNRKWVKLTLQTLACWLHKNPTLVTYYDASQCSYFHSFLLNNSHKADAIGKFYNEREGAKVLRITCIRNGRAKYMKMPFPFLRDF